LKKTTIVVLILFGLFLYACGEKEEKEKTEKTEVSKELQEKALEEGAIILREPTSKKLTEAAAIIYIDNIGFKKRRYGAVKFDHKKHQDEYKNPKGEAIVCTECHHDYQDGTKKNVWKEGQPVQLCVECHDPNKTIDDKKKLQLAFHENCKGCHEEVVKAGIDKDAPYKKCIKCMGSKK
jgi:Class III cytochrome C family